MVNMKELDRFIPSARALSAYARLREGDRHHA
jgi:hypothetical protein